MLGVGGWERCGFRPRVPPALLGAGDPLRGEAALPRGPPQPAPLPSPVVTGGERGGPGLCCAEFGSPRLEGGPGALTKAGVVREPTGDGVKPERPWKSGCCLKRNYIKKK